MCHYKYLIYVVVFVLCSDTTPAHIVVMHEKELTKLVSDLEAIKIISNY